MFGEKKQKLIIVVDNKTKAYGELLSALTTLNDDLEDKVIGVKDGTVETVVWDEKTFVNNQAQLSSNNKIVFIGENKESKPIISNINMNKNAFNKYGIYMGSLGNKAAIDVDRRALNRKDAYEAFLSEYSELISNYNSSLISNQNVEEVEIADLTEVEEKREEVSNKIEGFVGKGFKGINKGLRGLQIASSKVIKGNSEVDENDNIVSVSENASAKTAEIINGAVNAVWSTKIAESASFEILNVKANKNIQDQQFRCAVTLFYIDKLAEFME